MRRLEAALERLPLASPFRISGYVFEHVEVLRVRISAGGHSGRGEASGVYYLGDDGRHMLAELDAHRALIERGVGRAELRTAMPRGGARNAVDCALWELEAAEAGKPVWALAGLEPPRPLLTTYTLGAEPPEVMAEGARAYGEARALKLKLVGDLETDCARVRAVRAARPDAWIGVDANQGFRRGDLDALVEVLVAERVSLLEQPLPRGEEAALEDFHPPIPVAADESVLGLEDVERCPGRFDMVNIKLDKCGGLTEALLMAERARELGLKLMVGNMVGSSLSVGPAFLVGQLCAVSDLDGPIFLKSDPAPAVRYADGLIHCGPEVWGGGAG